MILSENADIIKSMCDKQITPGLLETMGWQKSECNNYPSYNPHSYEQWMLTKMVDKMRCEFELELRKSIPYALLYLGVEGVLFCKAVHNTEELVKLTSSLDSWKKVTQEQRKQLFAEQEQQSNSNLRHIIIS